jgi:putative endonuclease
MSNIRTFVIPLPNPLMWNYNFYVYILTNETNTVLYTGVTRDLKVRVWEHKNNVYSNSFTSRYKVYKLVYYEHFTYILNAIDREKQIKAGPRRKKLLLIQSMNPEWKDLYNELD